MWKPNRQHGMIRAMQRPSNLSDRAVVFALFALSGFGALVYELVWMQQLALVFGASATAAASVLAAYMFGLGVGAWLGAGLVSRVRRPVLWYAGLEVGIAVGALAVAPALDGLRALHAVAFAGRPLDGGLSAAFYWLGSFAVLAIPTTLMGATLPLLVRFWVARQHQISRGVASLYLANTLGAAAGTVVTGFVLIPRLGLGQTIGVAVAINLGVAIVAAWWFRGSSERSLPTVESRAGASAVDATRATVWDRRAVWMPPLAAGTGFVGMAYEVYWTRLLTHPLGGSLYAFATMLAAFLLGLGLGSAATLPRAWTRRAAWAGYGVLQIGLALVGAATVVVLGWGWLDPWLDRRDPAASIIAVVAILLPGALLLGASFPLAVRVAASSGTGAATASGRIYAWNTAGTILGSTLCGFWLLPAWHFDGTATLLTALALLLGAIACRLAGGLWTSVAWLALASLGVLALQPIPTPWALLSRGGIGQAFDPATVRYLGVGRSATVVLREQDGDLRLISNGLPEAAVQGPGSRPGRFEVAHWLGLLPATLRPDAERALVVGFGAGMTAGALPASVRQIDVAEIETEVIAANRAFADWRREDPLADPRIRWIAGDARSLLTTYDTRYDMVVSQPSHPWTLGAASLFTAEWYALVRSRLAPDGVLCQWIGLPFVDVELLRSQVATLLREFRHVEVYRLTGAVLLLASDEALGAEARAESAWGRLADDWRPLGVESGAGWLSARWLDHHGARAFADGGAISTDYRNLMLTRARWRAHRDPAALRQAIEPFDAARRLQAARPDLMWIRKLIRRRQLDRAELLLDEIDEPRLRQVGRALVDLARGQRPLARTALRRVIRSGAADPAGFEALAALLDDRAFGGDRRSPWEGPARSAWPELDLVQRAWQDRGDLDALRALDPALAEIDAEHPIHPLAVRLRIAWRRQTASPELARDALALAEPMIAARPLPALVLRARLARQAERPAVVVATLFELVGRLEQRTRSGSEELDRLVDELATDPTITAQPGWPEVRRRIDRLR